jgi:uncharacterized protein
MVIAARIICLSLILLCSHAGSALARDEVRITPASGTTPIIFSAEIMRTNEEMARGLMFRHGLPQSTAMVFLVDPPQKVQFWMRNTLIPLDMIFVDEHGIIQEIVTRYDTESDAATASSGPVGLVIEVNADIAKDMGIVVGDKVDLLNCETKCQTN